MTAVLLGTWPDRSPEWRAARRNTIGGSDIGIIMGWSQFMTREELFDDKLGLREVPPDTKFKDRGVYLEDGTRRWLLDHEGLELDPVRSRGMWIEAEDPRISYNADGVTVDNKLIEIKVVEFRDGTHGWGRAGKKSEHIPLQYKSQVYWGMGLFGCDEAYVGVLSGQPRFEFARYHIDFDQAKYDDLRSEAERFLEELSVRKARLMEQASKPSKES